MYIYGKIDAFVFWYVGGFYHMTGFQVCVMAGVWGTGCRSVSENWPPFSQPQTPGWGLVQPTEHTWCETENGRNQSNSAVL